jgi:hypothetical protein
MMTTTPHPNNTLKQSENSKENGRKDERTYARDRERDMIPSTFSPGACATIRLSRDT